MPAFERRHLSNRRHVRSSASDLHQRLKEKIDEVEADRRKNLRRQSDRDHAESESSNPSRPPSARQAEPVGRARDE
jgi:hypothetical protein